MKYTEKEIEALRNDPLAKLMLLLLGNDGFDKIIKDTENENSEKEKPTSNTDTHCSFKEDRPTPIVNKDIYNAIIDYVFTYKSIVNKLEDFGLGFNFGEQKCIINPLINIIVSLLASIWNDDFASSFINLVFDSKACRDDFVELYKIYCE